MIQNDPLLTGFCYGLLILFVIFFVFWTWIWFIDPPKPPSYWEWQATRRKFDSEMKKIKERKEACQTKESS